MQNGFSMLEHFPYTGLFILLLLGGLGFPFPEDATLILCGFLISNDVIAIIPALCVVYLGVLFADISLYSIGRKYGRRIVSHPRFHRIISPQRLSSIEKMFAKRGMLVILLGRHLVGLRAQLFLSAGVMRMPFLKFLIADAISSTVTIAIMVSVGIGGGHSIFVMRKGVARVEHIAALVVTAAVVIYLLVRYFRTGRTDPDEKALLTK